MIKATAKTLINLGTILSVSINEDHLMVKYTAIKDIEDLSLLGNSFRRCDRGHFNVRVQLEGSIEELKPYISPGELLSTDRILHLSSAIFDQVVPVSRWPNADILNVGGLMVQCADPMQLFWSVKHIAHTARNISVTKQPWECDYLATHIARTLTA